MDGRGGGKGILVPRGDTDQQISSSAPRALMRMENTSSIAQLQSDWFRFSDLDRASAVLAITQSGISIRKVAAQLHLSESLLRHLLQALQAPACDRDLARQGKMSTNELVRRGKAAGHRRSPHHRETSALDRDRETRIATDLICNWLLTTQLYGPAREAIVKEVRHKFLGMTQAGLHPSVTAPHEYSRFRDHQAHQAACADRRPHRYRCVVRSVALPMVLLRFS
jgi:transposase-like protein